MGLDANRFTTELPEHLICPICLDAATVPYTVCAQEHLLCEYCACGVEESRLGDRVEPTCPTCRGFWRPRMAWFVKSAFEGYKIRCEKVKEGCRWTGSVSDERKHALSECDQRQVSCPACKTGLAVKLLPAHIEKYCPYTSTICPRGGRNCGGIANNGTYLRKDVATHDARCGEFLCNLGCGTRTTLHRFKEHHDVCKQLEQARYNLFQRLHALNNEILRLRQLVHPDRDPSTGQPGAGMSSPLPLSKKQLERATLSPPQQRVAPPSPFNPFQPLDPLARARPTSEEARDLIRLFDGEEGPHSKQEDEGDEDEDEDEDEDAEAENDEADRFESVPTAAELRAELDELFAEARQAQKRCADQDTCDTDAKRARAI
ncbi:hypothetical protein JCM11251_007781 [Rhodosporidiobolus azoricus]